jgi:hypothetical protein
MQLIGKTWRYRWNGKASSLEEIMCEDFDRIIQLTAQSIGELL